MKVWDYKLEKRIEMPEEMFLFLKDIEKVCKKYNLSLSHEDSIGLFVVTNYDERNIKWLFESIKDY